MLKLAELRRPRAAFGIHDQRIDNAPREPLSDATAMSVIFIAHFLFTVVVCILKDVASAVLDCSAMHHSLHQIRPCTSHDVPTGHCSDTYRHEYATS